MNLAALLNSRLKGRGSINAGNTPYIAVKMKGRDSISTLREVMEILQDIRANNPLDQVLDLIITIKTAMKFHRGFTICISRFKNTKIVFLD